jgi:hypothetical protein
MRVLIFLIVNIIFIQISISRNQTPFRIHEDSLKSMSRRILEPEHDFEKLALNLEFLKYFEEILQIEGSIDYPFDSLTTVSRLSAPDGSFRIISWYVPLAESKFEYFGFFQSRPSKNEHYLYPLNDKASSIKDPQFETLDHDNWYGAYYTQLIHERYRRRDYYTLLGWRGDNPLTRKRIIEPIRLLGKGRPSFGNPVFRFENNRHRRIIYEYSAKVSMTMRYESHSLEPGKRAQDIIIFDRMAPTHSFLKGNYQFYVPETNIFDGFTFDSGKWVFVSDIDAKNPRRRPLPRPAPPRN